MINLPIPADLAVNDKSLLAFFNANIDLIKAAMDVDMSHQLAGAITKTPVVTAVVFTGTNKIRVDYEFSWVVHNACLDISDDGLSTGYFNAQIKDRVLVFEKSFSTEDRTTIDEF